MHRVVGAQLYINGDQQVMELLLSTFNASMKEHMQEMKAAIKSDREQMLAEISAEK
jgi:hypothetical protein